MTNSESVGSIAGLWRFPVKSMGGEQLETAEITKYGVLGDRAYALIESDTGKVVSAKSVRHFPGLLHCRAEFTEPPAPDTELPPVRISMPDGTSVTSDSGDANRVLSAYFQRDVTLERAAPDDYTIDQYHPDIEGADPGGHRDTVVDAKLGSALFAELKLESPVPVGSFFDVFPLSILTTSTLSQFSEISPKSRFDLRRFRMNVIVETQQVGFVENDWVGHELGIGNGVHLDIALPDPRCVMTTLAQDNLPADNEVLRTLVGHNKIQVGDLGQFPCCGVYASVTVPGRIKSGDGVALN